ncbi:primase-helicase family protein [Bradyrhizobium cenepequi]
MDTTHVTFFADFGAKTFTTDNLTLPELAERVLNASARKKDKLPWLKLAAFGDKRTEKGSLRHDANVLQISGVELDYDDEKISVDDAAVALRGIKTLIYTSPSHSSDKPRWRVLAPTSIPHPPEARAKLLARLDGLLKARLGVEKVAARESYALSQAYYFGWVCDTPKPEHCAEVVDGDFIDQRDDLAEYEAQASTTDTKTDDTTTDEKTPRPEAVSGFEAILSTIGDGDGLEGFNKPLSRAAASYVALHDGNPFDKEKLKTVLRDAINKAPKKATRKLDRYLSDGYLDGIIATAERKFVAQRAITLQDFVAIMSSGKYLFIPTRELWPSKSVNACIPPIPKKKKDGTPVLSKKTGEPILISASVWLDRKQRVEQISWVPGKPEIIVDKLVADGGWIARPGVSIFNLYRPSTIEIAGLNVTDADVAPWLGHVKAIYPDNWEHIVKWLVHRVQRPFEKINHALLLGGSQGIGKDTILEPVKHAVGAWNFQEISPVAMLGRFNGFLRSVILRISEARDLGEVNRFAFYDHLKTIVTAPPDVLRIDEKNLREHYVFNVCGVILTTNYKTGGIYLPPDDRRTYVAWSTVEKEEFSEDYWKTLWSWYTEHDGIRKVAVFLRSYDLSSFNPKAPPVRTPAFLEIVASGVAPEEIELTDLIERMGNPDALTIGQLSDRANTESDLRNFASWIDNRNNRKSIPHKLEQVGYVRVSNPDNPKQGIWTIRTWRVPSGETGPTETVDQRVHVYAKTALSYTDQVVAVRAMVARLNNPKEAAEEAKRRAEQAVRARSYDFNRY